MTLLNSGREGTNLHNNLETDLLPEMKTRETIANMRKRWLKDKMADETTKEVMLSNPDLQSNEESNILAKITERLSSRISEHIENKLESERKSNPHDGPKLEMHMDTWLSSVMRSHTCAICLELLTEPTMTIPCGHTFCSKCITLSIKKATKKICPCCRKKIQHVVPNIPMKQIIQDVRSRQRALNQGELPSKVFADTNEAGEGGKKSPDKEDNNARLESVRFRKLVLEEELAAEKAKSKELDIQAKLAEELVQNLRQDDLNLRADIARLEHRLHLNRSKIDEQEDLIESVRKRKKDQSSSIVLVRSTLDSLINEEEKLMHLQ